MSELWRLEAMFRGELPMSSMPTVKCPKCDGFPEMKTTCTLCGGHGRLPKCDADVWIQVGDSDEE